MPLGFTGDLFLGHNRLPSGALRGVASGLPAGTRLCVNFESTVAPRDTPIVPARAKILLDSPESQLEHLKGFPIAFASLGNNHIADYGDSVAAFTRSALAPHAHAFGAGFEHEPFHLASGEIDGRQIGFASYCTADSTPVFCARDRIGVRPLNLNHAARDLAALKRTCAHAVALVHWGVEDYHHPRPALRRLGRTLIDLGFAAVIGHHSHTAQGYERHRQGWIFYSLGNLYFSEHEVRINDRRYLVQWLPRRSWGLIPLFDVSQDVLTLSDVRIVEHRRNSAPWLSQSRLLRRRLERLKTNLAAPGYCRLYARLRARENLHIRFEEFLAREHKIATIVRKLAKVVSTK